MGAYLLSWRSPASEMEEAEFPMVAIEQRSMAYHKFTTRTNSHLSTQVGKDGGLNVIIIVHHLIRLMHTNSTTPATAPHLTTLAPSAAVQHDSAVPAHCIVLVGSMNCLEAAAHRPTRSLANRNGSNRRTDPVRPSVGNK